MTQTEEIKALLKEAEDAYTELTEKLAAIEHERQKLLAEGLHTEDEQKLQILKNRIAQIIP